MTLDKLNVNKRYFSHFLRGLIDGDGSIRFWVHPTNKRNQWSLSIYSAADRFIESLKVEIEDYFNVRGGLYKDRSRAHQIKYGKMAAQVILSKCYDGTQPYLKRKYDLAQECVRTKNSWSKSKTVFERPGGVIGSHARLKIVSP